MIDYPSKWTVQQKIALARTLFQINGADQYNFREFLEHELLHLDRINRDETDIDAIRQRQGGAQVIERLIKLMDESDDMYKALSNQGRFKETVPEFSYEPGFH